MTFISVGCLEDDTHELQTLGYKDKRTIQSETSSSMALHKVRCGGNVVLKEGGFYNRKFINY